MTRYCVILFHTTSGVMRAEKLLLTAGLDIKLIPTPREYSSDCGIAIRLKSDSCQQAKLVLEAGKAEFSAIYQYVRKTN